MATQAERLEELVPMIRDLVLCRFEENESQRNWPIRLHFVEDPLLSVR
ncbi:MAG: hypothetical protein HY736_09185 [Verrucomicrobia bacterium]|nr:hypothetical protein [Verrucomicrobiota bacterium]